LKKSYLKKPNKNFKKEVRDFLKLFDVRVHFVKKGGSSALVEDDLIEIDLREADTVQGLWSAVFHELAHILCFRMGVYKTYHHETLPRKKMAIYVRRYGLRAERYVDRMGEGLMKVFFPNMEYRHCYNTKSDVEWYYNWLNRVFPL